MAKLKDPLYWHWRDAKGGIVGVQGSMGKCARSYASPCVGGVGAQREYARVGSDVVGLWRGLSISEREAWDEFGWSWPGTDKYGDEIRWSGFGWFVRLNSRLLQAGGDAIFVPPAGPTCSYDPWYIFWWDSGTEAIWLTFGPLPAVGEYFRVQGRTWCALSMGTAPGMMYFVDMWTWPSISPVKIVDLPGAGGIASRHWFRARAGDDQGRVADVYTQDVVTGV